MKRRDVLKHGSTVTAMAIVAGCSTQQDSPDAPDEGTEEEGILPEEESDRLAEEEESDSSSDIELDISRWDQIERGIDTFYEVINNTDSRALAVPIQLNWDYDIVWAHNILPGDSNQYDITIGTDFSQEHVQIREEYICFEEDIGKQVEADTHMEFTELQGNTYYYEIPIPNDVEIDDVRQFRITGYDLLSQADLPVFEEGEISDDTLLVKDSRGVGGTEFPYYEPRSTPGLERPLTVQLQSATDEAEFTTFPRIPKFSMEISEVAISEDGNSTSLDTVIVELTAESDIPAFGGVFGVLQEQDDRFIPNREHEVSKPGGLFSNHEEGYIAAHPLSEDVKPTIVAEKILEPGEALIKTETGEERIGESTLIEIPVDEELDLPINDDTEGFVLYQWGLTVLAYTQFTVVDHLE